MKFKIHKKKIMKGRVYCLFFSILIFISCVWNIDKAIMPYCVSDEIGYWTAAAWINNFDWSPLMSHSQYYGWGYGILLSLIFEIPDPVLRFRIAIVINAILLVLVFYFLCKICNLFFQDNDRNKNIFIAGMAVCYSYNIIFAHTSMCEVFLTFLFVVSIYVFMRCMEKREFIMFFIFGMLILLQFATHLRMLVCIIALFLIIIYMCCAHNIEKRNFFVLAICSFLAIIVVYFVKDLLVQSEYTSSYVSERLTGNEGVGQHLSVFRSSASPEFWYELFFSLEGKIFYLLCSTLFMIIGALIYVIGGIKHYYICKRVKTEVNADIYLPVKIYVCLCFLGALAVDAIYAKRPERIDGLLYGRYVENMLPVMICMGCYWVTKKCNNKKLFLVILFLFPFLGKITLLYLNNSGIKTSIPLNVGWFSGWITQDRLNDYFYYTVYPLIISCCLTVVFILLSRINVKLACTLVAISWIVSAENGWLNVVTPQLDRINEVIDAAYELKQFSEPYLCVIPESLMTDTEEFVDVSWLQYQVGTSTLYEIGMDGLANRTTDLCVIISKKDKNYDFYVERGIVLWSNNRFSIVQYGAR